MFTIALLLLLVIFILVAVSKFNLHPFLALIIAGIIMGLLSGLDSSLVIRGLTEGFGGILTGIGIVIAFGTIIGAFLEKSGGARSIANYVLSKIGDKNSPLAMSITGFIVSIPVFCDSGFVILASLNKAIAKKTGISLVTLAVALSTGLYATHVFVPPTPGPLAAAATLNADIGLVILLGLLVAIPAALVGLFWAKYYCKDLIVDFESVPEIKQNLPSPLLSFIPLLIPLILISLKSISELPSLPFGGGAAKSFIVFAGNPVTALLIGVFLAFGLIKGTDSKTSLKWVSDSLKDAGTIILITGAGGAFGNILRVINIGDTINGLFAGAQFGIFLPFFIAAVLKSAQGSSTVAIITTAAIVAPLIDGMGFSSEIGKALLVLSISAGAMTVSHLNDSFFWVITQFSNMDTKTGLKSHTVATLLQGIASITFLYVLSLILL